MRRFFCSVVILIIGIGLFCGCKKEILSSPLYPLDTDTVLAALEEAELPWTIAQEELWPDGRNVHTLHDENGKLVAFISSRTLGERRELDASFMPYYDNTTITQSLPEDKWESVIVFVTLLYGGFDNKHEVYSRFTDDYDTENTTKGSRLKFQGGKQIVDDGEVSVWQSEVNGIYCLVKTEQPYSSMPQEYLNTVRFANTDWDTSPAKDVEIGTPMN